MRAAYYIDGAPVMERVGCQFGERWFCRMLLPNASEVAGPFTPIEIAAHPGYGLEERFNRTCVYAPLQHVNDKPWPVKNADPAAYIAAWARAGKEVRACVFTY